MLPRIQQAHFINIQYLSWSRQRARALLAYDCALRMRGLASVLVAVDTDEFIVPSTSGDQGSTGGTGHEWTLAEARGSVMRLSRKVFCERGSRREAAQAHLLSRKDRHPHLEHAGAVVAGVDALLSGSALAHHSKLLTLHRYAKHPFSLQPYYTIPYTIPILYSRKKSIVLFSAESRPLMCASSLRWCISSWSSRFLQSGINKFHSLRFLRYSSEKCPDETTVQDASAAVYEHKALTSVAVMQWGTLFDT